MTAFPWRTTALLPALSIAFIIATLKPMSAEEDISYQKPPQAILQLADVDLPPVTLVDRNARYLVHLKRPAYKTLSELAEPELRLAGLRINPRNHNRARTSYMLAVEIQEIATGKRIPVTGLPDKPRIEYTRLSPHSKYLSLVLSEPDGLALWIVRLETGNAIRLTPPILAAILDFPYQWSPDELVLYCHVRLPLQPVREERALPAGPTVQEASGRKAPGRTYQDLLKNKSDERKFDYYATTEIRRFALDGTSELVFGPGIYRNVSLSPNGNYFLVEALHRPYSYQFPLSRFPYRSFLADRAGKTVSELVDKPLRDDIPIAFDAVERGRRGFQWRNDQPATVVWAEALDDGDPARDVSLRDRLFQLDAPFSDLPRQLCDTRNRFQRILFAENGFAAVSDFRWKNRNVKVYLARTDQENPDPRMLFDFSSEDLYHLPGEFVTVANHAGRDVLLASHDRSRFYLQGEGYSPQGNRPFLDELDIVSGSTRRLWRADGASTYEDIVRVLDLKQQLLLTRIQSPAEFPNYFVRRIGEPMTPRQLTFFENPFRTLAGITKQRIHYQREDGISLSADLYLPAGYDRLRDGRLPMLMEAYPTEFKDKNAAGMLDSSPHQFVYLSWSSPVFWVARGYAVLENAQFPVVGEGDNEPNDTYIEQLVANARAAIRHVDEMEVVDPRRVAIMGHSYGAFMTVNLLAHSDLFAAGIARSGAYNRSLTPFGFQAEERTYWEAQKIYQSMSPFNYADKINEPILLIHGEADDNPGTFTLQSERLFQAIKGLGGRARLVLLPFESHGYAARENILHMLWEMDSWLDTYVKQPQPRG